MPVTGFTQFATGRCSPELSGGNGAGDKSGRKTGAPVVGLREFGMTRLCGTGTGRLLGSGGGVRMSGGLLGAHNGGALGVLTGMFIPPARL
jgi:hypothetical protein